MMDVELDTQDMGTMAMYLAPQESEHEETRHLSTGAPTDGCSSLCHRVRDS
jgi:hypothetical protein